MIERQSKLQQRRCEDQEDQLHRLREAGELVSIGAYQPTSLLTEPMHEQEKQEVKEEKHKGKLQKISHCNVIILSLNQTNLTLQLLTAIHLDLC